MELSPLVPPIAFPLMLAASAGLLWLLSRLSIFTKGAPGFTKSYACGEDQPASHTIRPNYSMFFPFAFFFTILHVVALTVGTVPLDNIGTYAMAFVYIACALVGLSVLYSR